MKLLMEYENVNQKVLLFIELMLQNAKQLQHVSLSLHVKYPNGIQFRSKCSSAFCGMTSNFLQDINEASIALRNKIFELQFHIP
jgi:hypothetical protein